VFFINSSITPAQRQQLLDQDKTELAKLTGEAAKVAEDRMKRIDARVAVGLDARTGKQLWANPVDVTDCSGVGIRAGKLTLMYQNRHIVLCGANANGHYWKQFMAGEFKRRRLVVLSADDGKKLWSKDANYRHRPLVIGNEIIAEPWSYDLYSGEQKTTIHPLTGKDTPWKFGRPGHHCGAISATPNMMFFRSGYTAYYDMEADSGTRHFAGHRQGCWINTIPANGLVMIPESSAGCACLFSFTATIVFEPRQDRQVWGVYSADGMNTPVKHMALNLGAPGDRRDAHGQLWLGYPRPSSRPALEIALDIKPSFGSGGKFYSVNSESLKVGNTQVPWLYASGGKGLRRCELPLISRGQKPAVYRVRLHFLSGKADKPGQRVIDVKLQGKTVAQKLDVAAAAGVGDRAVIFEYKDISVSGKLLMEMIPKSDTQNASDYPVLSAIEVIRVEDK